MEKAVPKEIIKQAAKTLKDTGYTYPKVAEILGISRSTAIRYAEEMNENGVNEFDSFLKRFLTLREGSIADKTLDLIEQKMDRAKFGELVNLYKTIKVDNTKSQNQVNILGTDMSIDFISTENVKDYKNL